MEWKIPETGEIVSIFRTKEFTDEVAEFHQSECKHGSSEPRIFTNAGGSTAIRSQCLKCGQALGTALSKANYPNAGFFDTTLREAYNRTRQSTLDDIKRRHFQLQEKGETSFQMEYKAYLASPEWKAKRALVMRRAAGICEGCGLVRATDVHHLTYRNFMDELLFQLVAVCRGCHDKIHQDNNTDSASDDYDERPCRGCRFQGDGECCITRMSETKSLADPELCGPGRQLFEPMK